MRVALRVLLHDLARAVGRAVFGDEDLERVREPLRDRPVERLPHEPCVVVRDDQHRDRDALIRRRAHLHRPRFQAVTATSTGYTGSTAASSCSVRSSAGSR